MKYTLRMWDLLEHHVPVEEWHEVHLEQVGAAAGHGLVVGERFQYLSVIPELRHDTEPLLREQRTRRVAVVLRQRISYLINIRM